MDKITIRNPGNIDLSPVHPKTLQVDVSDLSQVSDGYHTIAELYDFRNTLFITLCRMRKEYTDCVKGEWSMIEAEYTECIPWRSTTQSDGKCELGWFILGIGKIPGEQITQHLPIARWAETDFAETLEIAPPFDGHTSADVLMRLKNL